MVRVEVTSTPARLRITEARRRAGWSGPWCKRRGFGSPRSRAVRLRRRLILLLSQLHVSFARFQALDQVRDGAEDAEEADDHEPMADADLPAGHVLPERLRRVGHADQQQSHTLHKVGVGILDERLDAARNPVPSNAHRGALVDREATCEIRLRVNPWPRGVNGT